MSFPLTGGVAVQVTGNIEALQQQICIVKTKDGPELAAEDGAYEGWTVTVEGIDIKTNEFKRATTTVVRCGLGSLAKQELRECRTGVLNQGLGASGTGG